jgi:REP element-mobilizing transposase RayT
MIIKKTKPHGKDLRKGRYSENNQIYLVTTVTQQRQKVFTDFSLGRLVVHALRYQHQQQKVNSLAFVIMPDHIHWLFALQNDSSLAEVMRSVKGRSAHKIQKIRRERNEISSRQALWQKGYHDHALRKEEDLQQTARYIIANPIRAGIVNKVADYPLWDAIWL